MTNEYYVKKLKDLQAELDNLPAASEEFNAVLENIKEIQRLEWERQKLINSTSNDYYRQEDEKKRRRFEWIKLAVGSAVSLGSMIFVVCAEETRVITSKAFSWVKPKI